MPIRDETLQEWFKYHAPSDAQVMQYKDLRDAGLVLARLIVKHTPEGADQSAAIRKLRESIMTANAAIACGKGVHQPGQ